MKSVELTDLEMIETIQKTMTKSVRQSSIDEELLIQLTRLWLPSMRMNMVLIDYQLYWLWADSRVWTNTGI